MTKTATILEIHVLQNYAPNNLNRDDTGAPKECEFGGVVRSRISSQCLKRAVRNYPAFAEHVKQAGGDIGVRTNFLRTELITQLQQAGKTDGVEEAVDAIISMLGFTVKDNSKTEYMLFIGKDDIKRLVEIAIENWTEDFDTKNKELTKKIKNCIEETSAADVAMFGRMMAGIKNMNIDGACQVAHAFSVNKGSMEIDFFTAVDDLASSDTGAGMIGQSDFNSACFYRYALINTEILRNNLGHNKDLTTASILGFVESFIRSIPTGKQNSCAAHNPPSYVNIVAKNNNSAISYANAFISPVKRTEEHSVAEVACNQIDAYAAKMKTMYGAENIVYEATMNEFDKDVRSLSSILTELKQCIEA